MDRYLGNRLYTHIFVCIPLTLVSIETVSFVYNPLMYYRVLIYSKHVFYTWNSLGGFLVGRLLAGMALISNAKIKLSRDAFQGPDVTIQSLPKWAQTYNLNAADYLHAASEVYKSNTISAQQQQQKAVTCKLIALRKYLLTSCVCSQLMFIIVCCQTLLGPFVILQELQRLELCPMMNFQKEWSKWKEETTGGRRTQQENLQRQVRSIFMHFTHTKHPRIRPSQTVPRVVRALRPGISPARSSPVGGQDNYQHQNITQSGEIINKS